MDHIVAGIIQDVRDRGDDAVLELTAKFDRLDLTADTMQVSEAEVEQYIATVSPERSCRIGIGGATHSSYHERQMPEDAFWIDEKRC